ncbi:hypothetical protein ACET3Z_024440 [Daucus carota]
MKITRAQRDRTHCSWDTSDCSGPVELASLTPGEVAKEFVIPFRTNGSGTGQRGRTIHATQIGICGLRRNCFWCILD